MRPLFLCMTLTLASASTGLAQARAPRLKPAQTISAAAPSTSSVQLTWAPASDAPYRILRAVDPAGPFVPVGTTPAGSTGFVDIGLIPGTMFYYRVEPAPMSAAPTRSSATAVSASAQPRLATVEPAAPGSSLSASVRTPPSSAPVPTGACTRGTVNNSVNNSVDCRFTWAPVPGAAGYNIYHWVPGGGGALCGWVFAGSSGQPSWERKNSDVYAMCMPDRYMVRAVFQLRDFPNPGGVVTTEGPDSKWVP